MTFSASFDNKAKTVTWGILLLFLCGFSFPLINIKFYSSIFLPGYIIMYLIPIAIGIYCFLLKPLTHAISNNSIIIRRRIKSIILTKDNIIDVKFFHSHLLKNQSDISGAKGFFGYVGKTYLNGVGILRWYGTRKNKTVLITTRDHRKIIITPDEPVAFVYAFSTKK